MDGMSVQAQEARRDYKRQYRIRNRDKINRQQRKWRANNPDKVQQYNKGYWERKAEKARNIRASWADYGIDKKRYRALQDIARSDEYAGIVLDCALKADRKSAGHIVLSVTKDISYDHLEYHDRLGRCPIGRTDFYGARRLFFHYLDCALRDRETMRREG